MNNESDHTVCCNDEIRMKLLTLDSTMRVVVNPLVSGVH